LRILSDSLPVSPLRPSCANCRAKLQLTAVTEHPDYGSAFEVHVFSCTSCGRTQSYTLRRRRGGAVAPPETPSPRQPRAR
jgi:hypothetical protein